MSTLRTMQRFAHQMIVTYAALTAENGDAFECSEFPDKTIQASGTGTVTLEGSADATNWVALKDTAGVAISLAAASNAASAVGANPRFLRAVNAGGASLVTITCTRR